MVGPCITPNKSKRKQPAICSRESDDELSSSLKEILSESEGVYQHTHIQIYNCPSKLHCPFQSIDVNEAHTAIAESQVSNSFTEKKAFAYMVGTRRSV